jgi:hypothetical protein
MSGQPPAIAQMPVLFGGGSTDCENGVTRADAAWIREHFSGVDPGSESMSLKLTWRLFGVTLGAQPPTNAVIELATLG